MLLFTGPTGVGKSTFIETIQMWQASGHIPDVFRRVITTTSREPRKKLVNDQFVMEKDGEDYDFWRMTRIQEAIGQGEFLEYAPHGTQIYGTRRARVDEIIAQGKRPMISLNPAGAKAFRSLDTKIFGGHPLIIFWLDIPDDIRIDRLVRRGMSPDAITERTVITENERRFLRTEHIHDEIVQNIDITRSVTQCLKLANICPVLL